MPEKRAGRTSRENPPHHEPVLLQEVHTGSARPKRTARSETPLAPGERRMFYCHACEHRADAFGHSEHKASVGSFSPRCPSNFEGGIEGAKACLNLIAKGVECEPKELLDPRTVLACLEPWLVSGGNEPEREPPAPPSLGAVCGWHSALLSSGEPLAYLTERRGLTVETLHAYGVGWDRDRRRLTFPAWRDGRPVYLYRRRPVDGAKMVSSGGERQPYPDMPLQGEVWLAGGELSALSGRQMGLPAVSVCGCHLPDHALGHFIGRRVIVALDVGEEPQAKAIGEKLRSVGVAVRTVRLARLGLPLKGDLNDAMLAGHTAEDIRALRRGRRTA